ncbi:MAG TPA: serine/threonine-protein kinase [Ignavibacteria bacterium]
MIAKEISNYQIISLLGEGGMGKVYLAEHTILKRKVAIKVLKPELSQNIDLRKRYINEAQILSKLSHQNIITLFEFLVIEGNLYIIMEYAEGRTLSNIISSDPNYLNPDRCRQIFYKILDGFSYAHNEGIIHRDVKPSNIIIQSNGNPKLLDFGIAKIIQNDKRFTVTGMKLGSILYMSPEQILGNEIDKRSDIYSLGITLFEMLTGNLPYNINDNKESDFLIQEHIVRNPLIKLRELNPSLS